ncbi:BMQ_0737 family morphogenetic spore coat protein [Gracilibacillus alcaliphilus]|uniref:hypothetical protein n=1 Tax=Gracilibacillus alcaliphilus TaxID=1401441 RepID=UPI00195AA92C|nr:hypothetical protein [Gracilibacillus alcaliphilus]MBM7675812.1 hypothetical protein [Gracilibacillus alcaliphilus]
MQANNLSGGQELLCINTEKVYDWILNEATFDLDLKDLELPLNPNTGEQLTCEDIDTDTVSCTVVPAAVDPIVILDRTDQELIIDGTEVILQRVNIRKSFEVTIFVDLTPEAGGGTIKVAEAEFNRCEQVILCAPEGTDINVSFTDLDCFVCTACCDETVDPNELDVTLTVRVCQSIQSTFEVTLEIVAEFCEPRDMLPIPPCPAPTMPPQCPVIFPNNDEVAKD